ncbi:MAG: hypothetical protein JST89_09595 [Cyanobacteria bacterium SZAS-4]|nr:hypothetical protein [Cyanobacteria bacterium SZAS-4]
MANDSGSFEDSVKISAQVPPMVKSIDPSGFGTIRGIGESLPIIHDKIKAKIEHDPDRYSYPESFMEYVRAQFKNCPDKSVLVLSANSVIDGDLVLDWSESWISKNRICAIVCDGDLTVIGDVVNRSLESGILLLVDGTLSAANLVKGGATVIVLDDVHARGLVVGEYNDGVLRIGGNLHAAAYFLFDHDGFVRGNKNARSHTDDDGEWQEVLLPELFDDEDDFHPNVDKLWAYSRAGRNFFLAP